MNKKRFGPLVLAAAAAVALVGGAIVGAGTARPVAAQEATPTPTPITTGNIQLVAISPGVCFPLVGARDTFSAGVCTALDQGAAGSLNALKTLERVIGNNDGKVEPSDFAGIDLDGNQVHQLDPGGTTNVYDGNLYIIAFVPSQGPVRFRTNTGYFIPSGLNGPTQAPGSSDDAGQIYVCDSQSGTLSGPTIEDPDCTPGTDGNEDGIVVGRLRANWGSLPIAPIGPGTVEVRQGPSDVGTIAFSVVGEPRTLTFTTLETTIQDGVKDLNGDGKLSGPGECPLATTAGGFLSANGTAERSIVLARALDIEGNQVTGAVINWSTDDPDMAFMAAPLTPTLDLGSFGFGAPNIICGANTTGTVTVNANISKALVSGSTTVSTFDPAASEPAGTTQFTVVGAPARMTLTADPASIPCDGTSTSTVSAAIVDANGTPAVAGTNVRFDVQVLGTANPIDATTNDKGVATSTITPLSGDIAGVSVTVSSGNVVSSILVACAAAAPPAAPTAAPPIGATGPSGGPRGTIIGPNTGTGPGAGETGRWVYLLALSGLGLLAGSALVWTGARAKRR